jgi:hypothetical protein
MRTIALVLALLFAHQARAWVVLKPGIRTLSKRTTSPPQRIFAVRVNLRRPEIGLRTDARAHWYRATSSFARLYRATVAINADFFSASTVSGLSIANGKVQQGDSRGESFVAFGADNRVEIQRNAQEVLAPAAVPPWYRQAVGGHPVILWDGAVPPSADCPGTLCTFRHPRTGVGLSADRAFLYLVVVDGRHASAAGMTTRELGRLMKELGAHFALNLDGGGSSTLWIEGKGVVNRPSDGRERNVANHLAVTWRSPTCAGLIRGKVTGARGRPVAGAAIAVDGGRWKSKANARGEYEVGGVRCGSREVAASAQGHKPFRRKLTVDSFATRTLDVALEPGR